MRLILAIILYLGLMTTGLAQPSKGNPGGTPAPFGFTEILLLGGAALGGKKLYDLRKSQS